MQRRTLLSLAAAAPLAGCGFALRRAPDFVFNSVAVTGQANSPIVLELRRTLASDNRLNVLPADADVNKAQVIVDIPTELRQKVVVSMNALGQVREFQLRSIVHVRVRTPQGKELVPDTELQQQRDISFNESAVLAKEAEETLLYRDMQTDLVQQLMRRLAALKTL